jgi:hypothetical protein
LRRSGRHPACRKAGASSPAAKPPRVSVLENVKNHPPRHAFFWDYVVDKQSGFYPPMTRIIADNNQEICGHRRNLRMERLFYLSGA